MGQTLPNGIYLPAEGERNCYDGLEGNWRSLDGLISTVAGKASASHTHGNITNDGKVGTAANKPLITGTGGVVQAGSFGTLANTFCEGNDSRLSDARTPVAHTHGNIANDGKLTNGNRAVITGSDKAITESSVTDTELGYLAGVTSAIQTQINAKAADTDVVHKTNETSDNVNFKATSFTIGDTVATNVVKRFQWYDNANNRYAAIAVNYATDKSVYLDIPLDTKNTAGTGNVNKSVRFQLSPDNSSAFLPITNSVTDLGTSTNKWKTLNGVNPGALSLPDYSNVVNLDTTNWSKTGDMIVYTPTFDGWLQITIPNDDDGNGVKNNMISILDSGTSPLTGFSVSNLLGPRLYFLYPVIANRVYWLYIKSYSGTITVARLVKCLGNV